MARDEEPGSKAVMVRVPREMWEKLARQAQRERTAVATVLRRLAAERLEQIEGRDEEGR